MSETKLEDIGFYTLSNERAKNSSESTPLWRCELILTDRCNFKCPYCRGLSDELKGDILFEHAMETLKIWVANGLKNVRFSGGEPTLYKRLPELVKFCKTNGVEHIAVSSNGASDFSIYKNLIDCGVNDFSISLDADNPELGDKMAGGIPGAWNKVISNIKEISKCCYISLGMVFTEENVDRADKMIVFADSLGVKDIRVISSAQYNQAIEKIKEIPSEILDRHPILKYRVMNAEAGSPMRGLCSHNSGKCRLVLDDMAVANGFHFPCIIYMREGGAPIGKMSEKVREERLNWYKNHDSHKDEICKKNCLDVCVNFNDKAAAFKKKTN